MNNAKHTRRALLSSVVALVLCLTMLMGTTFAWFTDTATVSVNTITSGTLDITILGEDNKSVEGKTLTFKTHDNRKAEDILWEPGCTYELETLTVKNEGSLALKYMVAITGIQGSAKLNEAIEWTITVNGQTFDVNAENHLLPNETQTVTVKGHMKEDAGNEYQNLKIMGIAINVYATQDTVEYDSTTKDYDARAEYVKFTGDTWDGTNNEGVVPEEKDDTTTPEGDTAIYINTAEELAALAASVNSGETYEGKTVVLNNDLDLMNINWTPIGYAQITDNQYDWANSPYFAGTFDGNGHTIYNLNVDHADTNIQGLFGYGKIKEIKNLTICNATVNGLRRSAVLVGQNDSSLNISNVNIIGDVKVAVVRNEAGTLIGRGGLGTVSDVTVNVNEGSYVKSLATSNENWEYVGGVWGHAWPSKATDITSNIDVFAYASATGGIGGGCAVISENVTCTGDVTLTIKDSETHKGTMQCRQTNGLIYGFGVGSSNAATHTGCTSTGTLTIATEKVTDIGLNGVATGYTAGNLFGAPYYAAGAITIK